MNRAGEIVIESGQHYSNVSGTEHATGQMKNDLGLDSLKHLAHC